METRKGMVAGLVAGLVMGVALFVPVECISSLSLWSD